jgi:hypothetical protein
VQGGAGAAKLISHDAQRSVAFEEQQAFRVVFDHVQSGQYLAALALVRAEEQHAIDAQNIVCTHRANPEHELQLSGQF